jgi:hypothetical protein
MDKPGHNITRVRQSLCWMAIMAVLGLTAVGLTQCRLVNDTVTGLDIRPQSFESKRDCERRCEDEWKAARDREEERHKDAIRACEKIKVSTDRKACKKAEDAVHKARQDRIGDAKRACKNRCYNEGGGKGGS